MNYLLVYYFYYLRFTLSQSIALIRISSSSLSNKRRMSQVNLCELLSVIADASSRACQGKQTDKRYTSPILPVSISSCPLSFHFTNSLQSLKMYTRNEAVHPPRPLNFNTRKTLTDRSRPQCTIGNHVLRSIHLWK